MEPKEIKEIKAIIDLMKKNDLSVFEIEKEGFRLKLQRGASVQAAGGVAPAAAPSPKAGSAAPEAAPAAPRLSETVPLKTSLHRWSARSFICLAGHAAVR